MKKNPDSNVDMALDVDQVQPEHLSHVWGVLGRVAEGLALDGYEVGLRMYRWSDDGEEVLASVGPDADGSDLP